ncbi:MAG: bifunctional YncE family protein/alkaline phosphatase family protein [Acidobacteriia bacterium]|nr:bifunctional YncE family protein/alkaline phosphatase family protein [Terriglobia bacterium]
MPSETKLNNHAVLRYALIAFLSTLLLSPVVISSQGKKTPESEKKPARRIIPSPLPMSPDYASGYLLPNGWKLTPAGTHIPAGDLPLRIVIHPDGKFLAVTNNGDGGNGLNILDLDRQTKVNTIPMESAWLGLQFSPDGKQLYASGGGDNKIFRFHFDQGIQEKSGELALGDKKAHIFPAGLCIDSAGKRLYAALNLSNEVAVIDLKSFSVAKTIAVGDHPYTCVVSKDGNEIFVSNWGGRSVSEVDVRGFREVRKISVGDHSNDLVLSPDGHRLFVANANSNSVSIIDVTAHKAVETISVALHPHSPIGSTTNAVAVTKDGKRLFAANADNNAVAVVRLGHGKAPSVVEGFIPVGWYPTALALSPDDKTLYVAAGKGLSSMANPQGPNPYVKRAKDEQYIGTLFIGEVSVIPNPDAATLKRMTTQVYANTPFKGTPLTSTGATAIPGRRGEVSPIKHVIYIIKENRTYDQVFGDIKEGNGDPHLVLFGEKETPNLHALARQFVLLDNLYADAEVSADGHNWSTAAYTTDYVEKTWPANYSKRGREYEFEGGYPVASPTQGYLWDYAHRAGVSYRSYGEFVEASKTHEAPSRAREKSLEGHYDPMYRPWDLTYSDQKRIDEFLKEFREFEKKGNLPQLIIMRLPNDHTEGTTPGRPTPRAFVADNDLALGRLVEAVSHSKYWKDTAIFSVEDDAQNGPDHVDAHRTEALVISAYTKRNFVDSTMYSTSSILRTIELILGLPPMSQYDSAATPMWNAFTHKADLTPFKALPAGWSLDEKNPERGPGARRSQAMNFSKEDSAPDIELNEIIWKSVKGADSEMPPPVRAVWVRPREKE